MAFADGELDATCMHQGGCAHIMSLCDYNYPYEQNVADFDSIRERWKNEWN